MEIEYRHPALTDIEAITDVINKSSREHPLHQDETVEEVKKFTFEDEEYDPKGYLLAIVDGEIMGYGGSHIKQFRIEAKDDAWIEVYVDPKHRGKGIEQHFMRFGLDYIKKRKVGFAKRWCYGMEGWRHDLSLEFGMKDVRHSFVMVWKDKGEAPEAAPLPEGIRLEELMFKEASTEEIKLFLESMNEFFAEHYNFAPVPLVEWLKWQEVDREITRLTIAKMEDEIVGITMCEESVVYNKENNTKVGWADILGVRKSLRRKGIGRALLSENMKWIHDRGMDTIYLGMDAKNRDALGLYTSLGYEIYKESIAYELKLSA